MEMDRNERNTTINTEMHEKYKRKRIIYCEIDAGLNFDFDLLVDPHTALMFYSITNEKRKRKNDTKQPHKLFVGFDKAVVICS